jgi:hypothetical protein
VINKYLNEGIFYAVCWGVLINGGKHLISKTFFIGAIKRFESPKI